MQRIDDRTVELTEAEQAACRFFDHRLDEGDGIYQAADATEAAHPGLDPKFYAYLRD